MPIVVATGLAVGVFVGLIVVRGLGSGDDSEARAAAAKTTEDGADTPGASADSQTAPTQPDSGAVASAASIDGGVGGDVGAGSLATVEAATDESGEDDDAPEQGGVKEMVVKATLTFETIPRGAELLVDENELPGRVYTVTLEEGKALVKVEASAEGYRDYEKIFKVSGDKTIRVALRKRSRGGGSKGGRGGRSGPGGLIDL